jgi:hypothetical protein
MRFGATVVALALVAMTTASCGGDYFRQYEYEEEIYLGLDGSATVYVNASVAALNALRGASFDANPSATISREAVGAFYTTPATRLARRPSLSRRSGRRFVHVRFDIDHVEQLAQVAPLAWSTYAFTQSGQLFTYRQKAGASAKGAASPDWTGRELVAFRLHLPSAVVYHNAGADNLRRGNILVWEQPLTARLEGEPLDMEARFESQSILSRTLLLFAGTGLLVALMFAVIIWRVVRSGTKPR